MSDSTARHTAGDWEVTPETREETVRIYGGTEERTTVVAYSVEANGVWIATFGTSMGLEESLANARIGAAGPKMLAALKATLADFQAWSQIRGGVGTYRQAMDRIEAAIAKAEGR